MKIKVSKKTILAISLPVILLFCIASYFLFFNKEKQGQLKSKNGSVLEMQYPLPNSEIGCEFEIVGKVPNSWFKEGSFFVDIKAGGKNVLSSLAFSEEDWLSDGLKTFYSTIVCKDGCVGNGEIVLNSKGEDSFTIPVSFSTSCAAQLEKTNLTVFYGYSKEDNSSTNCGTTYPFKRNVPKTVGIGRASLEVLFFGPIDSEKEKGYFSSLPQDMELNYLRVADGVAYVDLFSELFSGITEECSLARIKSQITNTLKEMLGVNDVSIRVNGELM
jgi:hypothetical protein